MKDIPSAKRSNVRSKSNRQGRRSRDNWEREKKGDIRPCSNVKMRLTWNSEVQRSERGEGKDAGEASKGARLSGVHLPGLVEVPGGDESAA